MIWSLLDLWHIHKGRNHVNETKRHGIVARRLLEKNLGNLTNVFINNSFGIVARFCCPKSYQRIQGNKIQTVRATIPKELLTNTSVTFPKSSSKRWWATIACLAVSFMWLRPNYMYDMYWNFLNIYTCPFFLAISNISTKKSRTPK